MLQYIGASKGRARAHIKRACVPGIIEVAHCAEAYLRWVIIIIDAVSCAKSNCTYGQSRLGVYYLTFVAWHLVSSFPIPCPLLPFRGHVAKSGTVSATLYGISYICILDTDSVHNGLSIPP